MARRAQMPQYVIDAVVAWRGTEHPHADLDPSTTALIVIDMQNAFMMEGVAFAFCEAASAIVPNVNRLAEAVRRTGGRVFWIQNSHDEGCLDSWSRMHAMALPANREKRNTVMEEGTIGHELWAELDVRPEDQAVQKTRFSAFIQGSSDLPERLRSEGFDTVAIAGIVTNVCCESSARDAMMLNFRTIMISDACAAFNADEHQAALVSFYRTFGDVMETEFLISCLERNASTASETPA